MGSVAASKGALPIMERNKQRRHGAAQAVIGLLGIGLAFLIAAVPQIQAAGSATSRDQARVSSLYRIHHAITSFHKDHGELPWHIPDPMLGGWESSLDGKFLMELVQAGYLTSVPKDPVNDEQFHFRFCVYGEGSWGQNERPFFVLAATAFEDPAKPSGPRGLFQRGGRSWNDDFDFVLSGP